MKIAVHIFHAFYTNPVIALGFGRALLALYSRPNSKQHSAKSKFHVNYATRRFIRLPDTDPRKAVFTMIRHLVYGTKLILVGITPPNVSVDDCAR